MQNAPLQSAGESTSSISKKKSILVLMTQNLLAAAQTCYAAEYRSHCKVYVRNFIQELEKTRQSALQ